MDGTRPFLVHCKHYHMQVDRKKIGLRFLSKNPPGMFCPLSKLIWQCLHWTVQAVSIWTVSVPIGKSFLDKKISGKRELNLNFLSSMEFSGRIDFHMEIHTMLGKRRFLEHCKDYDIEVERRQEIQGEKPRCEFFVNDRLPYANAYSKQNKNHSQLQNVSCLLYSLPY